MSKVNVDEIKVGDLVETMYGQERWLCYVTRLDVKNERYKGIWSDNFKEEWDRIDDLTGHWKVINFEEESKMKDVVDMPLDELKVYTGKKTIEALLEGKVLKGANGYAYKFNCDSNEINVRHLEGAGWEFSTIPFNNLSRAKLTEVATPQVGDWVRVTLVNETYTGQVTKVIDDKMWAKWNNGTELYMKNNLNDWEFLSPEQVSEYKREQAFVKVGRKPNEFFPGDIVVINDSGIFGVVISRNGTREIRINKFNERKGYTAKPHQLTPISFVEQQVDLS
ncbi:hypothetical protein [Bacillus cereus]